MSVGLCQHGAHICSTPFHKERCASAHRHTQDSPHGLSTHVTSMHKTTVPWPVPYNHSHSTSHKESWQTAWHRGHKMTAPLECTTTQEAAINNHHARDSHGTTTTQEAATQLQPFRTMATQESATQPHPCMTQPHGNNHIQPRPFRQTMSHTATCYTDRTTITIRVSLRLMSTPRHKQGHTQNEDYRDSFLDWQPQGNISLGTSASDIKMQTVRGTEAPAICSLSLSLSRWLRVRGAEDC